MKKGVNKNIIWKIAMVLGLMALVLAIIPACGQSTPSTTPTTPAPKPVATPAAKPPPAIPANHAGRATCKMCHDGGLGGAPKFPAAPSHAGFTDDLKTCQACHK